MPNVNGVTNIFREMLQRVEGAAPPNSERSERADWLIGVSAIDQTAIGSWIAILSLFYRKEHIMRTAKQSQEN